MAGVLTRFLEWVKPRFVGRRKAAFLIGVLVATPAIIIETVRAYAANPLKGWITGLSSYVVVLVVAFYTAIAYDRRYSDRDDF